MNINIRPMTMQDLNEVYTIEDLAHLHPWSNSSLKDCLTVGYECWLLEFDNKIAAYAILSIVVAESHLFNICVHPDKQGLGLGKQLLKYMLDLAKQKQARVCFLEVRESNLAAIKLYQSAGFEIYSTRKAYYPAQNGREDAIMLRLEF